MNDRSKYPLNGVYRFENFADHTANNTYPEIPIGSLAGIGYRHITWRSEDDGATILTYIASERHHRISLRLSGFVQVNNTNSDKSSRTYYTRIILKSGMMLSGPRMDLLEVLDPRNGWLSGDGSVTVEYKFICDAVLDDSIWTFNIFDDLLEKQNMITLPRDFSLKAHKQLLEFHSRHSESLEFMATGERLMEEECLQLVHGVQLKFVFRTVWFHTMETAWFWKFTNVMTYCDRQCVMGDFEEEDEYNDEEDELRIFRDADEFRMRQYVTKLIESLNSSRKLADFLKKVEVDSLTSETMKKCVKFFFENSNDII